MHWGIIKLSCFLVTCLILRGSFPVEVQAADPVKLELGGSGAVPWSLPNIKPGDTGTQTLTLHNSGFKDGAVIIWISNIVNAEGANPEAETGDTADPGELGSYLLLNFSCSRLVTNIDLPTKIQNMPRSSSSSNYLKIYRLNAGETIFLDWQWELPTQVENDVQGDSLSFSINYLLEELPQQGGGSGGNQPIWTTTTPQANPAPSPEPSQSYFHIPAPGQSPILILTPQPAINQPIPTVAGLVPAPRSQTPLFARGETSNILALLFVFALVIFFALIPRRTITFQVDEHYVSSVAMTELITLQVKNRPGKTSSFPRDIKIDLSSSSPTGEFDIGPNGASHGPRGYIVLPARTSSVSFRYTDKRTRSVIITARPHFQLASQSTRHYIQLQPDLILR